MFYVALEKDTNRIVFGNYYRNGQLTHTKKLPNFDSRNTEEANKLTNCYEPEYYKVYPDQVYQITESSPLVMQYVENDDSIGSINLKMFYTS